MHRILLQSLRYYSNLYKTALVCSPIYILVLPIYIPLFDTSHNLHCVKDCTTWSNRSSSSYDVCLFEPHNHTASPTPAASELSTPHSLYILPPSPSLFVSQRSQHTVRQQCPFYRLLRMESQHNHNITQTLHYHPAENNSALALGIIQIGLLKRSSVLLFDYRLPSVKYL